MQPKRFVIGALALLAACGCGSDTAAHRQSAADRPTENGDATRRASGAAAAASQSPSTGAAQPLCTPPTNGLRLASDTVAGLPAHATIAELRARCPGARLDSVTMGGSDAAALRVEFPGATVWAIQHDYEDNLRAELPASDWAAEGDSLRFPSGALVPRTLGALRQLDSVGVIIVDDGDDTDGSYAVLCRFPEVSVVFGGALHLHAGRDSLPLSRYTALVPLWRASAADTLSYWRVDVGAPGDRSAIARFCADHARD